MDKEIENIATMCLNLPEYQRKQIISILIASMLTEKSDKDARKAYNKIISTLS
tara:strand:+ start:2435 stop:2593 length:159 start_codon:yes stop_codon:yes gene_type:complete